ncbi:hypothetical protein ACA910_015809 [Epithemia clementina (nom. ined.)]
MDATTPTAAISPKSSTTRKAKTTIATIDKRERKGQLNVHACSCLVSVLLLTITNVMTSVLHTGIMHSDVRRAAAGAADISHDIESLYYSWLNRNNSPRNIDIHNGPNQGTTKVLKPTIKISLTPKHDDKTLLATATQTGENNSVTMYMRGSPPPEATISAANTTLKSNDGDSNSTNTTTIIEFERQPGVVIVTKLHGVHQLLLLEQSLCLLQYAYNYRVNYDIIAFSTDPIDDALLEPIRQLVSPAQFTLVVDNRGLQAEIQALSPIRRTKFLERCNVSSPENLTWWSQCPGRVAYNWQAEFRAWHIWKHPALQPYKYMLWLDTDGFPTQVWDRDPIAYMIQHKLVIFFDNFPKGKSQGEEVHRRVQQAFNNQTLCSLRLVNGQFQSDIGSHCPNAKIPLVHGFFHITDLDFYRSDAVQTFAETWIGDCFLCREYDDQAGVTIPAAMLAPHRAWDMRSHGFRVNVFHNLRMDGKERSRPAGFLKFWSERGNITFPEAYGKCPIKAGG